MKNKAFIEVDGLIGLAICSVSAVILFGFSLVRMHFDEVIEQKQMEINEAIYDQMLQIDICIIEPIETESTEESELEEVFD